MARLQEVEVLSAVLELKCIVVFSLRSVGVLAPPAGERQVLHPDHTAYWVSSPQE